MIETAASQPFRRRYRPSPLSILFIGLTAVNIVIFVLAAELHYSSSDAAGNSMSNGLQAAYTIAGAVTVALITLLFAIIRYRPLRIVLISAQGMTTVLVSRPID